MDGSVEDRVIVFADGLPAIPERLLLAHARGEVLFLCGAGISKPAGLPDFRELVIEVYKSLDESVYAVIGDPERQIEDPVEPDSSGLTNSQSAEIKRFNDGDYDVVIGMLERRLDNRTREDSQVRREVVTVLRERGNKPTAIHRALIRLADRGGPVTIVTTNFDRLLEVAGSRIGSRVESYSLGTIPRPTTRADFAGVMHIHGVLESRSGRYSELVLSDQDFGEFYLRRRIVPDFIYDAARLFHLVLVGYRANDPPMRYLLNAVAADGTRFRDFKERFAFLGASPCNPVELEDWRARGITPIHYDSNGNHDVLRLTLERWAKLSAINGNPRAVDREIRRIVKNNRTDAPEADRDLFDCLLRRCDPSERTRLATLASDTKADLGWLDAIVGICEGKAAEHQ